MSVLGNSSNNQHSLNVELKVVVPPRVPLYRGGDRFRVFIGSACWLGLLPVAPGTFGALLGVLMHVLTVILFPHSLQIVALILAFLLVCASHFLLTKWAEEYWQCNDPQNFVLDEVAGYLLVPILFHHGHLWQIALWGFLWFRLLDIIKLPLARQIDRSMHGAWGILLDDLVSAGYAVLVLFALMWVGPRLGLDAWLISNS
jgi:phosphatidylglycerophosphatase A